jgi:transcriptional regulator with XRE-family HTH domain
MDNISEVLHMATFGERLRLLREEKKLTQNQIGKLLKVSESSIGKYESEQRTPTPNTITKLADYFNVTTDYLLGRTPHRTPEITIIAPSSDDARDDLPVEAQRSIEEFEEHLRAKYGKKKPE